MSSSTATLKPNTSHPQRLPVLPAPFYGQPTAVVAQQLLGQLLLHQTPQGWTGGIIAETEAYLGSHDPASHAYQGPTKRSQAMFGPAGTCYIYLSYGMHYCLNAVTQEEGIGEAVLIRALEPTIGISLMLQHRGLSDLRQLCNGPGKLVQALAIAIAQNGDSLSKGRLTIRRMGHTTDYTSSPRIGITRASELPLRFTLPGSPYVSRPAR